MTNEYQDMNLKEMGKLERGKVCMIKNGEPIDVYHLAERI
jgi:hypothetical protein